MTPTDERDDASPAVETAPPVSAWLPPASHPEQSPGARLTAFGLTIFGLALAAVGLLVGLIAAVRVGAMQRIYIDLGIELPAHTIRVINLGPSVIIFGMLVLMVWPVVFICCSRRWDGGRAALVLGNGLLAWGCAGFLLMALIDPLVQIIHQLGG